jgi:hypothetical protein
MNSRAAKTRRRPTEPSDPECGRRSPNADPHAHPRHPDRPSETASHIRQTYNTHCRNWIRLRHNPTFWGRGDLAPLCSASHGPRSGRLQKRLPWSDIGNAAPGRQLIRSCRQVPQHSPRRTWQPRRHAQRRQRWSQRNYLSRSEVGLQIPIPSVSQPHPSRAQAIQTSTKFRQPPREEIAAIKEQPRILRHVQKQR